MPSTKEITELSERIAFEEAVFKQRFISGISKNSTGSQFSFTVDCPMKEDFIAKNADGTYKEESLNPAWWAWWQRARREKQNA